MFVQISLKTLKSCFFKRTAIEDVRSLKELDNGQQHNEFGALYIISFSLDVRSNELLNFIFQDV
jgi:hypothetical protein